MKLDMLKYAYMIYHYVIHLLIPFMNTKTKVGTQKALLIPFKNTKKHR